MSLTLTKASFGGPGGNPATHETIVAQLEAVRLDQRIPETDVVLDALGRLYLPEQVSARRLPEYTEWLKKEGTVRDTATPLDGLRAVCLFPYVDERTIGAHLWTRVHIMTPDEPAPIRRYAYSDTQGYNIGVTNGVPQLRGVGPHHYDWMNKVLSNIVEFSPDEYGLDALLPPRQPSPVETDSAHQQIGGATAEGRIL